MTQAQAEALAAPADAGSESVSPGTAVAMPALSEEMLADLAPHLRPEPVAAADDGDAAEDSSPTATPEAAAPDAEGDDAGTESLTPEQEVAQWADLTLENPQTATRIPRGRLSEVFAAYNERLQVAFDAGRTMGEQNAMARAQAEAQRSTLQEKVTQAEALLEAGDTDGYREAVDAFPGGRKAFHRVQAEMEPVAPNTPEYWQDRFRGIIAPLAQFPAAVEELQASWNYAGSDAEAQRLAVTVGRLLAKHEDLAKRPSPEAEELERRKKAVQNLKSTTKADVSEGRSAPVDGLPFSLEDLKAGLVSGEQVAEAERTHPGLINKLSREAVGAR
jgi:hypothetical protein